MFRTVNCMSYIIYLRPTVDRVYFCEDLVLLQPYLNCEKDEIISIFYLFRRSPWIGATQQYYYVDDQILQFQTDLHFKYVTEFKKNILTKFRPRRCRMISDTIRNLHSTACLWESGCFDTEFWRTRKYLNNKKIIRFRIYNNGLLGISTVFWSNKIIFSIIKA